MAKDTPRRRFPLPPTAEQRKAQAAAAASVGAEMPPQRPGKILGKLPVDAVRGAEDLTEDERVLLAHAGHQAGDPVPDLSTTAVGRRLAAQAAQIEQEASDLAGLTPVDPRTPPIKMPEPVPIEELPEAEQQALAARMLEMQELQVQLAAAKSQKSAEAAANAMPASVASAPGGFAAVQHARQAAAQQQGKLTITDDLGDRSKPGFSLKQKPAKPEVPSDPEPEIYSREENSEAGGAVPEDYAVICPRCSFDLNTDLNEPTDADKIAFVACILGGEHRFTKEYSLFGGKIKVVFRALKPREVDTAIQQADIDLQADKIVNLVQYSREIERYKLAAGIAVIARQGHTELEFPEIGALEYDEENFATPVAAMDDYLHNEVFTTDSLRKVIYNAWAEFLGTLATLEAKAEDPDFFSGIA